MKLLSVPVQKTEKLYKLGEVFDNPYLDNKITEVLSIKGERAGWLWTTHDGKTIVSPHLGSYIWEGEGGVPWTMETGAIWLIKARGDSG